MMTLDYEESLWSTGSTPIGVDEAGRGALAGPVVAAAVVLDASSLPPGLDDSKKLSPHTRQHLRELIIASARYWSVGIIDAERIDEVNILQATFLAMNQAIAGCLTRMQSANEKPHLLIDGNRFPPHQLPVTTIIGGDGCSPSIAAASIIAKTTRDALMAGDLHAKHPNYGFDVHKGYATKAHRAAIVKHGVSPIHRMSFLSNILPQIDQHALDI